MKGINIMKVRIEKIKEKLLINFGVCLLTVGFLLSSPLVFTTEAEDQFCQQVKAQLIADQVKFQKHILKIKKKCQEDYESVQGYCTQEGLANIQAVSAGGQAVAQAVSVLKSDGTPKSAKNAMNMSKTVSYGLGALNAGIGAKCLANIKSCSNSCGKSETTKGCLKQLKLDPYFATTPPASTVTPDIIQTQYIEPLSAQDNHKGECKRLTSNAIAALAQGALHGVTGAIQGEIAKTFGQKKTEDESDKELEETVASEPELPETPTLAGNPNTWTAGTNSAPGVGKFAGNQNPTISPDTEIEDDDNEFGPSEYTSQEEGNSPGAFVGNNDGSSGSSGSSRAPASIPRGGYGSSNGDGEGADSFEEEDQIDPEGTFSSGGGYGGGFQGSSDNHYGSGGGYGYADDEIGGFRGLNSAKSPAEKKKEELKRLKDSIGGKHENIFEKASKILSAYCMEGPLKCE